MKLPTKLLFIFFLSSFGFSQSNFDVKINPDIQLPKDSVLTKSLLHSLNQFLLASQNANQENRFVLQSDKKETFVLLDEIKDLQKSKRFNNDYFYKPYLTNVVLLDSNKYLIQISFIGISESNAILNSTFEFIAQSDNDKFVFSSPLLRNTKDWKLYKIRNFSFFYKDTINKNLVLSLAKQTTSFEQKLQLANRNSTYYLCDDFVEMQKIIGLNYKLKFNGWNDDTVLSVSEGTNNLVILNKDEVSLNEYIGHDLWHDKLSEKISRSKIYKPLDEACAYLYGGSWGISWNEIFKMFKARVAINKNTDWKNVKENSLDFGDSKEKHLIADYVVNALIVKKIEREKGFSAVWEFLNCGKWEKGNEKYYQVLQKLTGITKENCNEKVWELISKEK